MKLKTLTILLLSLALFSVQSSLAGEMRVWKSAKGSQINAELLFAGETLIVLKTDKGKEISLPIKSLADEDIAYLKQLKNTKNEDKVEKEAAQKNKPAPEKKTPTTLPKEAVAPKAGSLETLSEGKGKGLHAYYEGKQYIAKVTNKGSLLIYYKDADGKVDERWKMVIRAKSMLKTKNGWNHYKYLKILKGNPAKADATTIKYTFQSEAEITTDVIFEFSPDSVTTWTRSDEGAETPADVLHLMSHHFTTLDKVTKDNDYLKKMKLKRSTVKGDRERFNFSEVEKIHGDTKECEISGPFFGKAKLIIKRAKDDEAKLTPSQYPGISFSGGFSLNGIKTDCKTNDPNSEKTTITFK